ncbi:MAG TPA: TonB family protein [Polyangiaceae bacterium]|nr:TonB family protein [Polyangiaceae bacterium]
MAQHPFVGLIAAAFASVLAHGFAYASLGLAPVAPHEPPPSRVSFRVRDAAPPPAPDAPKLPPPAPKPEPRLAKAKPKAAPSVNPDPLPAAPPPVDLRGVTLTNDTGGAAWSSAVGNGSALGGPVGPIGGVTTRPVASDAPARPSPRAPEIPLVDAADLSSRPVPPALAGDLRERYPAGAKQRGIGGSASVEARIEPDGRVRQVRLENETFAGFGEACKKTLLGSSWSPPRDKAGRKVATLVRYTCRFVVER